MPESPFVAVAPKMKRTTALVGLVAMVGALVAPAAMTSTASAAPSDESSARLVLDHGHVDLFSVAAQDGAPVLALSEDVTGSHVRHRPEDVELHVKEEARVEFPAQDGIPDALHGQTGYYLPAHQDPNLLWPGWDSQNLKLTAFTAPVNFHVTSVAGPGEVFLWSSGSFGGLRSVLDDGGYRLPGTITQEFVAHAHANWVFTEPGEYRFTVSADVRSSASGDVIATQEVEYYLTVGDFDRVPKQVTVSQPAASYVAGADVVLTAEQSPEVSGAVWSWESAAPGADFAVVEGQNSVEYRGIAQVDGEQVRAVVTVGETRVVSDPVTIVVEAAPEPEPTAEPTVEPTAEPTTEPTMPTNPRVDLVETPACFDVRIEGHEEGEQPGHLDAFFLYNQDGRFNLALKESIIGDKITRHPEDVEMHVSSKALTTLPATRFVPPQISGTEVYFLDSSTPPPGMISPGWAGESTQGYGYDRMNIDVLNVDGPGEVYVWNIEAWPSNAIKSYFKSGGFTFPDTIHVGLGHNHVKWAFTEPGVYYFDVRARLENLESGEQSGTEARRYLFTVGEDLPEGYRDCDNTEIPAYPPNEGELTDQARGDITLDTAEVHAGEDMSVTVPAVAGEEAAAFLFSEPMALTDEFAAADDSGALTVTVPADAPTGKHRLAVIDRSNLLVGWADVTVLPTRDEPVATVVEPEVGLPVLNPDQEGEPKPTLPGSGNESTKGESKAAADAQAGGANTDAKKSAGGSSIVTKSAAPISTKRVSSSAKCYDPATTGGAVKKGAAAGGTGAGGPDGSSGSSSAVGDPAPADLASFIYGEEGHFDLGPAVEGGNLQFQVRDDRTSPPTLQDPGSMIFVLGEAARRAADTIPNDLDYVAQPGQDIWMIQQIQEAGVPWLGWNTQHESIVNGPGADGVEVSLDGVQGPGDLALFLNGDFGQVVGTKLFDTVGGSTSYRIPANTHQHANWVFTEPGAYAVTFTLTAGDQSVTQRVLFAVGLDDPSAAAQLGSANDTSAPAGAPGEAKDGAQAGAKSGKSGKDSAAKKGVTATGAPCALPQTGTQTDVASMAMTSILIAAMGAVALIGARRFRGTS